MNKIFLSTLAAVSLALASARAAEPKAEFVAQCSGCHGKEGKGDTRLGQRMGAGDFTDAKVQASMKDEAMFKAIKEGFKKEGKTVMRPYAGKLTDEEIKALVKFVRDFHKK